MRWDVKIEELPDDGGYQYVVMPELTPAMVDRLLAMYGGPGTTHVHESWVRNALPTLDGHSHDRGAVAHAIKTWITEQEKRPITVFKEVIDLG